MKKYVVEAKSIDSTAAMYDLVEKAQRILETKDVKHIKIKNKSFTLTITPNGK